ncbi:two-component system regulatory protein YycI [Pseudalkalibacillus salsuginis]|uniref:two-component system regulatory protein YycI n=1 Tax=Pseudalkalibacillus salsuginis TaxID=2910972 RepID=UPI001F4291E5|nr:two-component system regulatory protein YycI [Pseudalkalibacillus salsuginis]MCF6410736.1 two-component system regulatory protein YycI [Pseudalkalibacillus salsuginis]
MDWKNIKTIFIFSFLILNFYLGSELYEKEYPDFATLKEETLKKLDIEYNEKLPTIDPDLPLVSGTSTKFTDKAAEEFTKKNDNQEVNVLANQIIYSILKEPVPLSTDSDNQAELETFVEEYVPNHEKYEYWKHDEKRNLYLFRQHKGEVPFYFSDYVTEKNLTGLIEISTNKEDKITSYKLTSMDITELDTDDKLITAEDALLVQNIPPGTTLLDIDLVYFTLIMNEGWKVFVPSWHIVTEDQELMVDATDSSVITLDSYKDEVEESEE